MKKILLMIILTDLFLYALQFLVIPLFYDNVIGSGNEGIIVFCITTVLITIIGMIVFSDDKKFWLLSILIYMICVFMYSPRGAYGIGITGMDLDGLHSSYNASERYVRILILVIIVALLQSAVWCLIKPFKTIIKRFG